VFSPTPLRRARKFLWPQFHVQHAVQTLHAGHIFVFETKISLEKDPELRNLFGHVFVSKNAQMLLGFETDASITTHKTKLMRWFCRPQQTKKKFRVRRARFGHGNVADFHFSDTVLCPKCARSTRFCVHQ
jgi:hypothetical protein